MPQSSITPPANERFNGFHNTPFLWEGSLEGLLMFKKTDLKISGYPKINVDAHIRLGKLVEQFVLFELGQDDSINVLKSNLQVFDKGTTVGELDCLLTQLASNIHLEIAYKFYLYDPLIPDELDRWIGPNRKDGLVQKLKKLKERQLPLLHHQDTVRVLEELKLIPDSFAQQLYFKAQLFVPFDRKGSVLPLVNNECIRGHYIRSRDLNHFSHNTFHIPSKLDWLVEPHSDVSWLSYEGFKKAVSKMLDAHQSPLCWMKSPEGKLEKMFVVWWG